MRNSNVKIEEWEYLEIRCTTAGRTVPAALWREHVQREERERERESERVRFVLVRY
jgi:hypothetical protein